MVPAMLVITVARNLRTLAIFDQLIFIFSYRIKRFIIGPAEIAEMAENAFGWYSN